MEALITTSLPSGTSVSIPIINHVVGGQSLWTRSCCKSKRRSFSNFIFPQAAKRPFLFPSPPSSVPSSAANLPAGACSRVAANCKYYGRRRCSRILMASSFSSPIPHGDDPGEDEGNEGEEVERALGMDGSIPSGSGEFLRRVSSRAYDMRRILLQTVDSSSYEVLDHNPWRDDSKPVFVLTQQNNQLCTMKTRQSRSEVERELGLLFTRRLNLDKKVDSKAKNAKSGNKFSMLVEDIREGVLVFEDETEASRYCELLQGGGHRCEGTAELEVSSVFDICQKMRALAVLFRRGRTPPLPNRLEQNLRARKRSLEDQDIL